MELVLYTLLDKKLKHIATEAAQHQKSNTLLNTNNTSHPSQKYSKVLIQGRLPELHLALCTSSYATLLYLKRQLVKIKIFDTPSPIISPATSPIISSRTSLAST